MSRIVWLASYPKSGNTWLRVFLSNFQHDDGHPVDINNLELGIVASDRNLFDSVLGVESSDMTEEEIDYYRPRAYRYLAAQSAETLYMKVHDAWGFTSAGDPLIPAAATSSAIYVTRNPLDVAISFAHHLRKSVAETIDRMADETMALSVDKGRLRTQLKQRLLSWSGHALSWLDQRAIPMHVIRYEDMSHRPVETFASAVRFLGWEEDLDRVRRAVAFSSFEILQEQENAHGFKERQSGPALFFRQGRAGAWREVLTEAQVAQIVRDHGPVMRRLGYLSADGCIPDGDC
jgi:aryl sulfotransferase